VHENRIRQAASSLGAAAFCVAESVKYARQRKPFGEDLARNQGIQFPLVELATQVEMLRLLIRKTAWEMDGMPHPEVEKRLSDKVSMCNYWANRLVCEAADRAMQVHGGIGYSRHKPFEHIFRHHRRYRITEGAEEIQMRKVGAYLFGYLGPRKAEDPARPSPRRQHMNHLNRRSIVLAPLAAAAAAALPGAAFAQKKYGPGVTDTEIKIGQTIAYSGPASAYGQLGRAETAYFKFLNDKGGINGRKINFISLDDGFSPPKAVEMTRKLVEQDEVALMFGMLGTALNTATRPYLNQQKVPQLFIAAGSATFASGDKFPWTIGWQPTLQTEAAFYARSILASHPGAKIGVLYQDDDFGKELLAGLKDGLAGKDSSIVATASFQATDPTVDSQLITLKGTGCDTLMLFTYAKQAAQAIRKIADLGWKPDTYLHLGSASVGATLIPAGLDKSVGIKTAGFIKDTSDPQWANDAEIAPFFDWMKKYMPDAKLEDSLNLAGWAYGQTIEQVLRQCGDDLTRENIMRQALNLKNWRNPALLPGSLINTSPTDYRVVEFMKLQRFNGKVWELI